MSRVRTLGSTKLLILAEKVCALTLRVCPHYAYTTPLDMLLSLPPPPPQQPPPPPPSQLPPRNEGANFTRPLVVTTLCAYHYQARPRDAFKKEQDKKKIKHSFLWVFLGMCVRRVPEWGMLIGRLLDLNFCFPSSDCLSLSLSSFAFKIKKCRERERERPPRVTERPNLTPGFNRGRFSRSFFLRFFFFFFSYLFLFCFHSTRLLLNLLFRNVQDGQECVRSPLCVYKLLSCWHFSFPFFLFLFPSVRGLVLV